MRSPSYVIQPPPPARPRRAQGQPPPAPPWNQLFGFPFSGSCLAKLGFIGHRYHQSLVKRRLSGWFGGSASVLVSSVPLQGGNLVSRHVGLPKCIPFGLPRFAPYHCQVDPIRSSSDRPPSQCKQPAASCRTVFQSCRGFRTHKGIAPAPELRRPASGKDPLRRPHQCLKMLIHLRMFSPVTSGWRPDPWQPPWPFLPAGSPSALAFYSCP